MQSYSGVRVSEATIELKLTSPIPVLQQHHEFELSWQNLGVRNMSKTTTWSAIGVGAGKFLGVRRVFPRISENFGPLFVHEDRISHDLQKTPFFQIKAHWVLLLLVFSESLHRFLGILQRFLQISTDFHHIKTFGGATPHFLHHCDQR